MIRNIFLTTLIGFSFIISACADVAGGRGLPPPRMTFAQIDPMAVNTRVVNVNAVSPGPVANDFIINPAESAQEYIARRFTATGTQGALEISIEKSSVTRTHLDSGNKVTDFLNVAGTDRYLVTLSLRMEHMDDGGRVLFGKVLTARRLINIEEHASLETREKAQMQGMEALFAELDKEIRIAALEARSLVVR
jgi:hypothetical protein